MANYKERVLGTKKNKLKIISFLNEKGGSCKTTMCCNLAYSLSAMGKNVLVIDSDPQANASMYFGYSPRLMDVNCNFGAAMLKREDIRLHIRNTYVPAIDIVTSHPASNNIESSFVVISRHEDAFKNIVNEIFLDGYYDYILVDCNPYFGELNSSIVRGSNFIIIPLECAVYSVEGLKYTYQYISFLKEESHLDVSLLGIVFGKVDFGRGNTYKNIMNQVKSHYKSIVFSTYIPVDIAIAESQMVNSVVGLYAPKSKASQSYKALAQEVVDRIEAAAREKAI